MKIVTSLVICLCATVLASGQSDQIRQKNFNIKNDIALEGYDPVSYFNGKPLEGKSSIRFQYRGVVYLFANTDNLGKFKSSPETYEPAFGGWCAYAMGTSGGKVKIDLKTFKIVDGRLYLFYNFWGNNTLTDWNKQEVYLKAKAEENWKRFVP